MKSKDLKIGIFSIGNVAPLPNQRATTVPIKNMVVATRQRNGFWNLLTFSIKGSIYNPTGTGTIKRMLNNLLSTVVSTGNTQTEYHSGNISK